MGLRVLITGVVNFWGRELAARLVRDPDVDAVYGLADPDPGDLPEGVRVLEEDIRAATLARLLAPERLDVIVHNDVLQFGLPGQSSRFVHDINVIGTLQLLAAAQRLPTLRGLVVRSSAAIYGSEPDAPQFFTEEMADAFPLRTRFQRDLGELEQLSDAFARRRPDVAVTTLRLQPVLGRRLDTPIVRLVRSPVVPVFMGFDPRVQVLDEDDSVSALAVAVRAGVRGPVNVAGEGTVSLLRMIRLLGRVGVPIPHPLFGRVTGAAARLGGLRITDDMVRFLRYGRAVDTRRMRERLGFQPARSTLEAIERAATAPRLEPVGAATGGSS